MSKTEFQQWVKTQAGWVGFDWSALGTSDAQAIREYDPALAELVDRRNKASEAIFAYCKGKIEGK